ncbi:MAG: hypothetical protein IJ637_01920 [Prevotella sp.]|nr:hypothetical protein [Prevotella sp.]
MITNRHRLLSLFILFMSLCSAVAQDVMVTVTPAQNVLPPQVLLYISDPGKYFNITLTNTSAVEQNVYLAMQLEQTLPASGLSIVTPAKRQPPRPFTIPAGGTRTLSMVEIKTLFNHVPASEIRATEGLFTSYSNGSFGLLPEGEYEARLTAYRWASPQLSVPAAVSSPTSGIAHFTVCYKAQAPQFLTPLVNNNLSLDNSNVAQVDAIMPMFTWTQPVIACNAAAMGFKYSFKVVEVMDRQNPDDAMERNPVVYSASNLMAAQCIIPQQVINSQFRTDKTYAAQVTATSTSANVLNYVMLENSGKSTYRLFKIKTADSHEQEEKKEEPKQEEPKKEEPKQEEEKKEDDNSIKGAFMDWGEDDISGLVNPDSLYSFSLPNLVKPQFPEDGGARKMFVGNGIKVEWVAPMFRGGEGKNPELIEMAYDVQLYSGGEVCDREAAMATTPIYSRRTTELEDSIPWDKIKDAVENGTYLVLRVNPVVTKGSSVAFTGDSTHIKDCALVELLSKKFFQCSNLIDITNTKPTTKKASELKGKVVMIGEYELTLDNISAGKKRDTWQGKGHVLWQPMGTKVHVCVEFDDLKINTEDRVYEGTAKTYSNKSSTSDIQVVDKLFSDWGIDNLISDTGIPYANELQSSATGKVKDIAKKINLSKYYGYVKKGQAVVSNFLAGEVKDLYMPLALPKSINKSPVDIQIVSMKFAATHATMDVLGQFTLPNTSYTKNDILVLGAPRLCISPNKVLPEAGTVALLSDFTIKDPKSSYEMSFKAPKNVMEPEDGCYIAWKDYKFEVFGIDVDMKIPGIVKDKNGTATNEQPIFNVRASIADWDDWMIDNVSIDPFQVKNLPGWTFTATDIVYDHSFYRNSNKMGKFPKTYDKKKAGITGVVTDKEGKTYKVTGDKDWQGLYIKKIGIEFPKSLQMGTKGTERLSLSAENMFFDKSGATLEVSATNLLSAKTGKMGGWEFTLSKVYATFIQDNFNDCGFNGQFKVPLLSGKIGYDCKIKKMTSNTKNAGQYAYIFKTQQVEGLSLDFFLAEAKFKKEQTYFLLESVPNSSGKQETNCELLMGGDITIGGTDYLNKKIKNSSLPMKFEIPGVHFCGMRLANCKSTWTSKYESAMQKAAKNASLAGKTIYQGKEFELASGKVYFSTGKWSLASAQKKLGPFSFSLDKYKFDYKNKKLATTLEGTIKFIDGISLGASAGITINANVTLPSDLSKISDIKIAYGSTDFNKLAIDASFAGMGLKGSLDIERGDKTKEGYTGTLNFTMPGNLFSVDAKGGYYKYEKGSDKYTYGFFYCKLASSLMRCDPVVINSITAGFYYNCKRKTDTECTPQKGLIGVVAGLSLSTSAGKEMLEASMDMTVIYDTKKNRLSTFIFNGDVKAVSGLVDAKCNMVYENNSSTRYLQVDITIDAMADAEKLTTIASNYSQSLSSLKSQLNSKYTSLKKVLPQGGLSDLKEEDGKPDKSKASKSGSACSASMGAKITLQVKVTWRESGKNYDKPHWHLYLGEPDFNKRCQFTFLKFKSKVVSVDFGANAYICVGNELPNNGKLPDIPQEIRTFLNGGGDSKGIEGADVSKANRAREISMKEFNDQIESIGGGVMFGAQVWGYINVDLGVFYLYTGATAGFDMSIIKLPSNVYCTNISGTPGYKGWYGYGQLYAYLYAKFGIRINLGFWKKDWDVVDAGIGGVFRMQGPRPSHFDGEARVKLRLFDGLVNVNRKYSFSCGKDCDLFYGNALDNFELFGDLSIGYAEKELGWKETNAINPKLLQRPYLYTQAPLEQPFRVVDQTELARMRKNYDGDASDLEAQASRTFYFRSGAMKSVTVYEYTSEPKSNSALNNPAYKRTFYIKASDGTSNLLDITQLNANRWYKMEVTGYAKEIQNGKEVDPVNYDEAKKKYVNKAWSQTKTYYFRTTSTQTIEDCPVLEDYVAIAYPSKLNRLNYTEKYLYVHEHDLKYPSIALTTNLKNSSFKKGTLYWRLYKGNSLICSRKNKWVTTSNTCNMTPESAITGYSLNNGYYLKLEYVSSKSVSGRVTTTTTTLMNLGVYPRSTNWKTGNSGYALEYEKPFLGARVNSVTFANTPAKISDYEMSRDNKTISGYTYRRYDPYLHIGYLANYAFFGGWEFDADRIDLNVTTAQSLIYTDKGGVYEGKLGSGQNEYNCYNDYSKIKALSIYDRSQWSKTTEYPLPQLEDSKYTYTLTGLQRANAYVPSSDNYKRVKPYITDMYRPYYLAYKIDEQILKYVKQIDKIDADNGSFTKEANGMEDWYSKRVGTYCTASSGPGSIMIPAYQFPIIWGSMLNNSGAKKKLTAWGTLKGYSSAAKKNSNARGHEGNAEWVFCDLLGTENVKGDSMNKKNKHSRNNFKDDTTDLKRMTKANFSVYRVNAYDYNNCQYTVNTSLLGSSWLESFDISNPLTYYNK